MIGNMMDKQDSFALTPCTADNSNEGATSLFEEFMTIYSPE